MAIAGKIWRRGEWLVTHQKEPRLWRRKTTYEVAVTVIILGSVATMCIIGLWSPWRTMPNLNWLKIMCITCLALATGIAPLSFPLAVLVHRLEVRNCRFSDRPPLTPASRESQAVLDGIAEAYVTPASCLFEDDTSRTMQRLCIYGSPLLIEVMRTAVEHAGLPIGERRLREMMLELADQRPTNLAELVDTIAKSLAAERLRG